MARAPNKAKTKQFAKGEALPTDEDLAFPEKQPKTPSLAFDVQAAKAETDLITTVVRILVLINGGAAIAVLALIGNQRIAETFDFQTLIQNITCALYAFGAGVAIPAFSGAIAIFLTPDIRISKYRRLFAIAALLSVFAFAYGVYSTGVGFSLLKKEAISG